MLAYPLLAFIVICGVAECGHAPFIIPCREADAVCLKSSAQKALSVVSAGIPELGVESLDPMLMEQVKTSQAGLNMDFRNTSVTGLSRSKVLNLKRVGSRTLLDLKCSVDMVGDYTLDGKLLIMPIEGTGRYNIKIRDIIVKIIFHVGEVTKNGKNYWTVKSWKHTSEVQKGVHFQFQNLFNGNKKLAGAVHQFANENWREIFQEVAPPIVKAIVAQIIQEINKLFDAIPIKEMVLE